MPQRRNHPELRGTEAAKGSLTFTGARAASDPKKLAIVAGLVVLASGISGCAEEAGTDGDAQDAQTTAAPAGDEAVAVSDACRSLP